MHEGPTRGRQSGIPIYVVEDDAAVLASLLFLLEQIGFPATPLESAEALLETMPTLAPGCLLLDLNLPGMTGLQLLARLRAAGWPYPAVVVTGMARVDVAVSAFHAGAVEFLTKPVDVEMLEAALQKACAKFGEASEIHGAREAFNRLSPREYQVMEAICDGLTAKEAALKLGLSHRTVEVYKQGIYNKLGVEGLVDVVRLKVISGGRHVA